MKYMFGKQDIKSFERGEENCWLMTNGLGGFSSLTILGSCARNDHAVLMSCKREESPNRRYNMIHWLEECLAVGEREVPLSSQAFADGSYSQGWHSQVGFVYEDYPRWSYLADGVEITKEMALLPQGNTIGISYEVRNLSEEQVELRVTPWMEFVPKGEQLKREQSFSIKINRDKSVECDSAERKSAECKSGMITSRGRELYYRTNGQIQQLPVQYREDLYYAQDACDGRPETGCVAANHCVIFRVEPGESLEGEIVYSADGPVQIDTNHIQSELSEHRRVLTRQAGLADDTARMLVLAADQFISYRASTGTQTILAGYPFFEDWGRDTMIALTGCCLSTGRYEEAKGILRTFMQYSHRGLMPNLFPEGKNEPRYNTVDAALLFILAVYRYYRRTGDRAFVIECGPVMEEIIRWYVKGTDFHIVMEEDGLIRAGDGFDQVTWMDVRIGDILPTPRHGKPVEINAYWYNALCILDEFSREFAGERDWEPRDYKGMAERTRKSFQEEFWNEDAGCLKDVISGTEADRQIRCNQIWAVAQPFSILDEEQEQMVVDAVFKRLYTPLGLRTLDPADPQFQPIYGGELMKRDLAYHQGTVWVYPLGAYYLAMLKVNHCSQDAMRQVRRQLESTTAALREGCIGQLPEIYDGLEPVSSKGCFAQAWSVGELLRVFEALERLEAGQELLL